MSSNHEVINNDRCHSSESDALAQVSLARVGSLVNATDTYLVALHAEVLKWAASLNTELKRRCATTRGLVKGPVDLVLDGDDHGGEYEFGTSDYNPGRERFGAD